jgi:hypothetical protein
MKIETNGNEWDRSDTFFFALMCAGLLASGCYISWALGTDSYLSYRYGQCRQACWSWDADVVECNEHDAVCRSDDEAFVQTIAIKVGE